MSFATASTGARQAPGEKHLGPLAREGACDGAADRASGSVDHRDLVLQHHRLVLSVSYSAVDDADTATSGNWAPADRPVRAPAGVYTTEVNVRASGDRDLTQGAGRGRRRVPGADRAAPPGAPGALLPDARILPGRRGRPPGHAARRLAGPRRVRGTRLAPHLALPDRHQPVPQRASLGQPAPAKAWDVPGVEPPEPTRLGEVVWLEPFPDALLEGAIDVPPGPEARYEQTESISLAFVTALQLLPPRQLAVLDPARRPRIPRERGGRHARLDRRIGQQRPQAGARRPAAPRPPAADREPPPAADSPSEEAIVAKFVSAYESADLDALVALLTDDVFISMPPMPFEYEGRDVVARFCASIFARGPEVRPRADASQRSAGVRRLPARPDRHPPRVGLIVLTLAGDRICAMTRFENSVLPWFGLPRSLPSP